MKLEEARGKMSRKELAEKVGVSYQMIYYIENGKKKPAPRTAKKIADALDLPIAEIWNMFYSNDPCSDRHIS